MVCLLKYLRNIISDKMFASVMFSPFFHQWELIIFYNIWKYHYNILVGLVYYLKMVQAKYFI